MFGNFLKKLQDYSHNKKVAKEYNNIIESLVHWNDPNKINQTITTLDTFTGGKTFVTRTGADQRIVVTLKGLFIGYAHGRSHLENYFSSNIVLTTSTYNGVQNDYYNIQKVNGRLVYTHSNLAP